jgi:antitoxin component of MazEF toxin-antitoxin module
MKRTVSKMGNSSLVMSLPNKWVKEHNVQKGDELSVEPFERGLIVSLTNIRKKEKRLSMDVSPFTNRTILAVLNSAYLSGYDTIKLTFKDKKQLLHITKTVQEKLLGFEVIQEKGKTCTAQSIAEPSQEQVDVIIRKIFLLIKQNAKVVLEDTKKNKFTNIEHFKQTKVTIYKFTNFVKRMILSFQFGGKDKSYFLWSILEKLTLIYHAYFYYYERVVKDKGSLDNSTQVHEIIERGNELFELLYNAFYTKDYITFDQLDIKKKKLNEDLFILTSQKKSHDNAALCYIYELIRNIQMASSSLPGYYISHSELERV